MTVKESGSLKRPSTQLDKEEAAPPLRKSAELDDKVMKEIMAKFTERALTQVDENEYLKIKKPKCYCVIL